MADIATLGLEVRSDQVERGADSLDRLSRAAARAEAAAMGVATGSRQAASGSASVASSSANAAGALDREAAAARRAQQALERQANAARAANDNARRMGGSMSGLAAQFQDIGVTAAMGMNPAIIALQQGTQIAGQMEMAMQGGAKATDVLGTAFKSLFSPLTFVTIALTAIAAGVFQMVDWAATGAAALRGLASVLETIAPYATMAAAGLALLYAPAIIGGIVSIIALLGRMAVAAVTAAAAMAAANPAAAFVLGITAAVAAANIFRDELAQIFGRDIVADAKNAVNFVIGAFVGAFNAIKATWGALPAALGDLVYSTANTVIGGVESMINKVASLIDGFIAKINSAMKSLPFGLGDDINIGTIGSFSLPRIDNPHAGAAAAAVDTARGAMAQAQGTDYVGGFASAIARGASAATGKLKELASAITTVDEKSKKRGGGKTEAEKYSDIVDGANRRIASLRAEQEALGLTEFAATKLRYETDLLNEAQQKGITLTDAQKGALSALAGTMAGLEIATKKTKEAIEFGKDLVKGFVSDLRSGLEQGKGFWRSFGDAAMNVLDKIVDKLLNNVIDALFQVNSAASGTGGGGFLGGLFGWIGKIFGFAKGGVFDQHGVTAFAKGGVVNKPTVFPFAKGVGLMGEAGPEAIMPLRRGPDGRLGVSAHANNNQPQAINVNVEQHFHIDGAVSSKDVQQMVRQGASEAVDTVKRSLTGWQHQIARDGSVA